jgi:hypothetical protein
MDESEDQEAYAYVCLTSDAAFILDDTLKLFEHDPRPTVTDAEIMDMFMKRFPPDSEGRHTFTDDSWADFMNAINGVFMDRVLAGMVKDGKLEMMHDGKEFCFRVPK